MNKISEHITFEEAVHTSTGIDNVPSFKELEAMKLLADKVFEPLRIYINSPITITSMYRSAAVNKAVGGVKTSQHLKGEAMDIKATGGTTNAKLFYWIKDNLEFDELIWEKGTAVEPAWIHISYKATGNRNKVIHL